MVKKIAEKIELPQEEIVGKNVSGRPWIERKKKFTNGLMIKNQNMTFEDKKAYKEMKDLEKQIKADVKKERDEQKRIIQQKRRFKEEEALKAKNLGPFKQAKKSRGANQILQKKDWKKVKSAREFGLQTSQL